MLSILETIFNAHPRDSLSLYRILGGVFLLLACPGEMFFLFQALIPILGYTESGAIACALLGGVGIILLAMHRHNVPSNSKLSVPEEITERVVSSLKEFTLDKTLKNNAVPLSLLSLGAGILLSQFKHVKEITGKS